MKGDGRIGKGIIEWGNNRIRERKMENNNKAYT